MPNSSQRQSSRLRSTPTDASISRTTGPAPTQEQPLPANQLSTPATERKVPPPTIVTSRSVPRLRGSSFDNPRANIPLFGSLNVRDAIFYCKATVTQLKAIVASAPQHLRARLPSNPTKDMLLETVLAMRQEEGINIRLNQRTPEESLQELMNLNPSQLKSLAASDREHLAELMRDVLQADDQMEPRKVPESAEGMIITILSRQIDAHKSARALQDNSLPPPLATDTMLPLRRGFNAPVPAATVTQPAEPATANLRNPAPALTPSAIFPNTLEEMLGRLKPDGPARAPPRGYVDSDEEDSARLGKKQKLQIVPQGFNIGSTANIEQVLRHYPGKETTSPSLSCKELLGPFITVQFTQGGNNVPTFLQEFKHWRKTANGMPSQAEMEAHTLGRIVHMEMHMHDSPRQALENRLSLEIALRRLFALLYIEEAINTGKFKERTSAWQFVHLLHESIPTGTVMCDHIDDAMTQRMTLEKKRIAAIKALEDARANKHSSPPYPRNYVYRGNRRQDRNERQGQDRCDKQERPGRQ